jgi:hypothetical protein
MDRPGPVAAATAFVNDRFPAASAAILAGSVVMGQATDASDLDIVVIGGDPDAPRRESVRYEGWPVEVFPHTEESIHGFWGLPAERVRPALALMCGRGVLLFDRDGTGARVQRDARALLEAGPPRASDEDLVSARYGLTDVLDDFVADPGGPELPFITDALVCALCELAMMRRHAFRGTGKWMYRMAREADPAFAETLSAALDALRAGDREPLATLARAELDAAGGPLFEGYRADGRPLLEGG